MLLFSGKRKKMNEYLDSQALSCYSIVPRNIVFNKIHQLLSLYLTSLLKNNFFIITAGNFGKNEWLNEKTFLNWLWFGVYLLAGDHVYCSQENKSSLGLTKLLFPMLLRLETCRVRRSLTCTQMVDLKLAWMLIIRFLKLSYVELFQSC